MLEKAWALIKNTASGFMADGALSQGAAIAYYMIFSLAPVLVIVIAVAGLAFGHEAAQGAIVGQLSGIMGRQSAEAIQAMIESASDRESGILAISIGIGTLIVTASGVFGQMQTALNTIWKCETRSSALSGLVRARIVSLGLVIALGFLLLVSLVISAALSAMREYLNGAFPGAPLLLEILNFLISLGLISVLFAAIYKFLPDTQIAWRDVAVGAITTAVLFAVGKSGIGFYLGRSQLASSYGRASSLIVILLWIYYSAQIFLLGAEFTRAYSEKHGTRASQKEGGKPPDKTSHLL